MILISACLAGVNCKYDGGNNLVPELRELVAKGLALPVCPEQLGGAPTPREPVELGGACGEDVLDGKGRATTKSGADVTEPFITGAGEVLELARLIGASCAILKQRSPSCGSGYIYDGTFTGLRFPGRGVTAALLERNGIKVYSEDEIEGALKEVIER